MSHSVPASVEELLVCGDMEEAEHQNINVGEVAYFVHSSPDKDTGNEDSLGVLQLDDDTAALIVADGLGGHRAGAEASATAIKSLFKTLRNHDLERSLRTTMMNGLEQGNQQVIDVGGGAATTIIGAIIHKRELRVYHIGDSGGLLVGQRGVVKLKTIAHSPVGHAEASGLIDEEMALAHESRHIVSNVLGSTEMSIEVGPVVELARYDTLLLCSDGLLDNLRIHEIVDIIRKGNLRVVAEKLRKRIQERMTTLTIDHPCKPDDLSFVLYRRNS
ncbi:MAG: PP2C family serine/threonine-protein phosphatase [Gammaproteobacteria bacterium]